MSLLRSIDDNRITGIEYEVSNYGMITDVVVSSDANKFNIEFHHKSFSNYTPNKVAIYILEKLKEYAIAYGIVKR